MLSCVTNAMMATEVIKTWTVLTWIGGGGVQIIAWSSRGEIIMVLLQVLKLNSLPAPVTTSSVLSPIAMMLIKSEIETFGLNPK